MSEEIKIVGKCYGHLFTLINTQRNLALLSVRAKAKIAAIVHRSLIKNSIYKEKIIS